MKNSDSNKGNEQKKSEQERYEQLKKELLKVSDSLLNHPNLSVESKAKLKEAGVDNFVFKDKR